MTINDDAAQREQAREQSAAINARLAAGESLYPYVDVPDEPVDAPDEPVYADEVTEQLDPADAAMLLARLADPDPGMPLHEAIIDLGFDPAEFGLDPPAAGDAGDEAIDLSGLVAHRQPLPLAQAWLLYDAGDLVAAYRTAAAAETARSAHVARQAELDAQDLPRAWPVYHLIEVCPVDLLG